jgi:cytochrome c5
MTRKNNLPVKGVLTAVAALALASMASGVGADESGEQVYKQTCHVCHATGIAGAPKLGDKAAWEPRAAQGMDTLVKHATNGFKAMPPKGGNMSLTEDELRKAIQYMLGQAGVSAK